MDFTYTAKRSVQSGHSAGTSYTITIDLQQFDRASRLQGTQRTALDGTTVTIAHREETDINIATDLVPADGSGAPSYLDMREFLDSVKGGELFTVDDGSSPFSARVVDLANPYTETREGSLYFRYSFRVRVA